MLEAARRSGVAAHRAVFEVFARSLPAGRRFGVVAGTGRLAAAISRFRFDAPVLAHLASAHVVGDDTLAWLADYRFSGDVIGYAEGDTYFPDSPVVRVEGTFGETVLLETLVLSILNHDAAIASAAARMSLAAHGAQLIEMGSRRTHEESAVAAARAAYVAGFDATSNLEAGRRYGVPTTGTAAHAFTLLYDSEKEAFTAQVDSLGKGTTLLVDTYDVKTAVALAMEIAGPELGAVRLDSGDLLIQATEVRAQLDAAGNTDTRIIVTSDLDEYAIAGLAAGPVSGYGVGTALVTGSGAPTASMVYKLVQREDASGQMQGVAKKSKDKSSVGGRKWAMRRLDDSGVAQAEVIGIGEQPRDDGNDRPLMIDLVRAGEVVDHQDVHEARARHEASRAELPRAAGQLSRGEPVIPTVYEED